jgi:hypothetical protein
VPFDMRGMSEKQARKAARRAARNLVPSRESIVKAIITVIREDRDAGVTPTLLNHEGALIHSLRGGLCLAGLKWAVANEQAREIVVEAFQKAGARRPTWKEGQPEWTDGGVVRSERFRCGNCAKPLAEDQKVYCGKLCREAAMKRRYYQNHAETMAAIARLRRRRAQTDPD